MAKMLDAEIKDLKTPWHSYMGPRVEQLIKKHFGLKAGYAELSEQKEEDGMYHLRFFADEEQALNWKGDPDGNHELLLFDIALPETGGGGSSSQASYVLGLYRDSSEDIVTKDNEVKVRVRFTSQMYNPIDGSKEDTSEGGVMTIQTRLDASGTWTTRGTVNVPSIPADETGRYTTVDITPFVSDGSQQVRLIVRGEETGVSTRFLTFNVTKTTLRLNFASQWEKPVTDGVMRLQFYVQGAVSKTLHLLIDGERKTERNIGSAIYTETPFQIDITDTDRDTVKVLTHGVHEIEAWLSVNDSSVESEHIRCQVMVVANPDDKTPYLILNDVATRLTNWTAAHILSYALYNPEGTAMPLKFILQDYRGTETYMTIDEGMVPAGVRRELDNSIEIESEQPQLSAYMKFISGEKELHEMIGFEVDNSENYAPTPDPDFILNPKARTNAEENPMSIVNAATGETLPSTWRGFGLQSDGWVQDTDGQKCLRIPAGRSLDIDYEAFTGFIGTDNRSSLTIEMDVATKNATNFEDALLRMCSYRQAGGRSLPLGFELKPTRGAFLTQNRTEYEDQDIAICEGTRTHIAINILHGINGTSQNYVRIFVNGIINREFAWEATDSFVQFTGSERSSQGIRLGSKTCDIDLYGMRIYKKALSASDVRKDFEATLPTVAEKMFFRSMNDILADDGRISYTKTKEKYNTMVVTGAIPSYSTGNVKTTTDLEVNTLGDPEHSGKMTAMETSGQGTSSRSYWKWNIQFKFGDTSRFVNSLGEDKGAAFALDSTVPAATKIVAKLNWASSQQSHKAGSCNLFNELHRQVVGGTPITRTEGFENCRVSVKQKPYMLFVRTSESEEPVFYGQYTFGPGKGDKPTFGYDKKTFPNYLMIEGCDNGEPLTNHRIPYNDDITIGGDEDELLMYNGNKQWEIDMGNPDTLSHFRDAFNFIYEHNPHIEPFVGTLAELQESKDVNRLHLYWVTQAGGEGNKFDLYRFDFKTEQWVDAGVRKLAEGKYEKLNLATQLGISPSGVMWEQINKQFIDARVARFRENASKYFDLKDLQFCMMFLKLIGASDNRAKNTYMYIIGVGLDFLIRFAQDDLDTIFLTDNVGRKNKPYDVEEHDRDADGGTYWNGEENALYDLMEMAFPAELRAMMKSILTAMANMATDHTPFGCISDYYFSIQRYFPAVAYNEQARLLYEEAALARAEGRYTNATDPLSQSLGDQLQGEMQWVKMRIIYMSSFASYGEFSMNGGGSLDWRSATTTQGRAPEYEFHLTTWMSLYPSVTAGSSTLYGKGNALPQRVRAGESFTLGGVAADNDTAIQLHGINYYTDIGDFGDKSLQGNFNVAGERLRAFSARLIPKEWRPTTVTVTAPLLEVFDIEGAATVGGTVDFSRQTRLTSVNLKGTSVNSFRMSSPGSVAELRLPSTLTELRLEDYTSLTQEGFETEGASNLQTFVFRNCPGLSSQAIVSEMCAADNDLHEVTVEGVDWKDFPLSHLMKLAAIKADLKGRISLATSPTFEEKKALVEAFGDIDSEGNKLFVDYTKVWLTSMELTGDSYYEEPGQYKLSIIPSSTRANNFIKMEWSISANSVGVTIDPATGIINIPRIGTAETKPEATVTVKATLTDGSSVSSSMKILFYSHECQLGDYVYADGTTSDILNKTKTVVAICFYIDSKDKTRRLGVGIKQLPQNVWGLCSSSWPSGIKLNDDPDYNVFDIPTLANKNAAVNQISDANYRDEVNGDVDGFKRFDTSDAVSEIGWTICDINYKSVNVGDSLPWGMLNTLKIIQHCNRVLGGVTPILQTPTSFSNLQALLEKIQLENTGDIKYRQFYFPAAYQCYLFEPTIQENETLSDKFKAGNWFLPSAGEMARIIWYYMKGFDKGNLFAIFSQAYADNMLSGFKNEWMWTSTESHNVACAWRGNLYQGLGIYSGKDASKTDLLPVCAF